MAGRVGLGSRIRGLIGAIVLAAGLLGGSAEAASAAGPSVSCHLYTGIPVALAPGTSAQYTIDGELCATQAELTNGETVQLLIHGGTYNHSYWDFGTIDGVSYSYARDLAAAGYPTFAIDEIGTGQSPHPPSADVTIQAAAYVAHETVQDLRHGAIGGTRFGNVIEVGHSFGSITTWVEAGTYHDVAGAIITGLVHVETAFEAGPVEDDFYPAIDDPRFARSGLDPGYLTTLPGTRAALFYNTADSDPNVIAQDEATKDVLSATELSTAISSVVLASPSISEQINVPVLLIVGGNDKLNCGTEVYPTNGGTFNCSSGQEVATEETPDYSAQAQLRACVVPNSGHDINLALNHDLEEADGIAWAYEYVGQLGAPPISSRLLPPDCSS